MLFRLTVLVSIVALQGLMAQQEHTLLNIYSQYVDRIDQFPDQIIEETDAILSTRSLSVDEQAMYHFVQSDAYYFLNNVDASLASGQKCLDLATDSFPIQIRLQTLNALGQDLSTQGFFDSSNTYYHQAIVLASLYKDSLELANLYHNLALNFKAKLQYTQALRYLDSSYQISLNLGDSVHISSSLRAIGYFQQRLGDQDNALSAYMQGLDYCTDEDPELRCVLLTAIADLYIQKDNRTQAREYLDRAAECYTIQVDHSYIQFYINTRGDLALIEQDTASAMLYFLNARDSADSRDDRIGYLENQLMIYTLDKNNQSVQNILDIINEVEHYEINELKLKAYNVLKVRLYAIGAYKEAYQISHKEEILKDKVLQDKNQYIIQSQAAQFNLYQKEVDLKQAKQDLRISRSKWLMYSILIGSLLTLCSGLYVYNEKKKKLQKEADRLQEESRLLAELAQIESQALRAQMNPHFLFNTLNSVKGLIINDDRKAAALHITKFSKLIRSVLDMSRQKEVPIAKDLENLQLYLSLEKKRFREGFDYTIHLQNEELADAYCIPPMVIQPFVENSIWHGFKGNTRSNLLDITIEELDHDLKIIIVDNGVGRSAAENHAGMKEHKSHGLDITAKRLELFSQEHHGETKVTYKDLYDQAGDPRGTQVTIYIPKVFYSRNRSE